jgi:hypothetical protein
MAGLDWLFKLGILWICLSVVIIATMWYLITVIKPHCPDWWRRVIADEEPHNR